MPINIWPKEISKAKALQDTLRKRVEVIPLKKTPRYIAGVDASFPEDKVLAVATLYDYPEMQFIQYAYSVKKGFFPYIPGLLSFREGPAIISAVKKLKIKPDLILFDGQGIAHPNGIGIASHIGVILDIPAIGCAKSRLVGEFKECNKRKGSWTYMYYRGEKVGVVLRTRGNVKPVFVSPGHMIDIKTSLEIVMRCISRYRIPEPLRSADHLSRNIKKYA